MLIYQTYVLEYKMHDVKCEVHKLSRSILSNVGWVINVSDNRRSSSKIKILIFAKK